MGRNLKQGNDVEKATDSLGGGILDTDLYKFKIKLAYFGKSGSGAESVTVVGEMSDGSEFKTTQWVISGDAKGNKPYYERGGKKYPLPGYTVIDDMMQLAAGISLGDAETEEKTVKIYDYETQKDVPTEVDCLCDIRGESVVLAIHKQLEDKNVKGDDGVYAPEVIDGISQTRESNEVAKVLSLDGATFKEIGDEAEAEWADKWLNKNKGKVRDRRADKSGAVGTAGAPKKTAKKAMFT